MCKKIFIVFFLLLLIQLKTTASGDSIAGSSPYLPEARFFHSVYNQPGARFQMPNPNQGFIETSYSLENRENYHLLQEGNSGNDFDLHAEGFSIKGKKAYWGTASYNRGTDKQVQWSDVSDFPRLGPYLISDSIGGDRYGENYHFSGGFALKTGLWSWGAEVFYSAGNEYRKRDPRPKTTVSDLSLNLSASRALNSHYRAGFSLTGGLYRQDVSISVAEPNTNYAFFPMKGFGLYDIKQYAYSYTFSWLYKGKSYGFDAFLFPENGKGWIGTIGLRTENIDSYAGSNIYPFSFDPKKTNGSIGYIIDNKSNKTLLKADFLYETGKGTERVYKEVYVNETFTDNVLLSESRKYTRNRMQVQVSALQEWVSENKNQWIETSLGARTYEERYASPADGMNFLTDYRYLTGNIRAGSEWFLKKGSSFLAEAGFGYDALISSETKVPENNLLFQRSIQPNLAYMDTSPWSGALKILYQFPVSGLIKLYISTEGSGYFASEGQRYGGVFTVGFRY